MYLEIKNIAAFPDKKIDIPEGAKVIEILDKSAKGKTTIARVLYAFLTGRIDSSLLKHGEVEGSATLVYNGKEYKLHISKDFHKVDRIFYADYADYLVLTENTPLYTIYRSPDRMNLDFLINKFVPEPEELTQLQTELYKLERQYTDYDKIVAELERNIKHYEEKLQHIAEELTKIEEKLKEWREYENVKIIIKKREKAGELENVKKLIEEYERERKELSKKLQSMNYDDLKQRRKQLADEVAHLYVLRGNYDKTKEALQGLKKYLEMLEDKLDILYELNVPLFGGFPDPETLKTYIDDLEVAIEAVTSKYAETSQKIKDMEEELSKIDREITDYVRTHERLAQLDTEVEKLERKKRELEHEVSYLERRAKEVLEKLGKANEEELLQEYMSMEDLNTLLAKKNDLLKEKQKIQTYIESFRKTIERAMREKRETEELQKKYEEIKKKISALRNEWQKKRKEFRTTFMNAFTSAFKTIKVPDFDLKTMKIERPPHTYSESERLYMTIAYQYALLRAIHALGYEIPLIVIDLIVPMDSDYESEVIRLSKTMPSKVIILKTSDTQAIQTY